ncbi:MAG: exo-alpha-sialidase [Actinobacteria bacterium]|nr:MAG: exo-alpha-sialidase [Actinomycetota bacterium]
MAVVVVVGVAGPAFAGSVRIQKPRRISLASPFSGPCVQNDPTFARGVSVETSVSVDPRNPRRIVVSWIQDGHASDLVMASRDGGRSFARVLVPGLSACTGGAAPIASDPTVAFSVDGRVAYFSGAVGTIVGGTPAAIGMAASHSFDGGFSWSRPAMVFPVTNGYWDKPELTVNPHRPRVAYYTFDRRLAPDYSTGYSLLSTTTNRGRTWSRPRKLYDAHISDSWPGTSQILVNRDGSLLDVFALATKGGLGPTQERAIRSVDGGRTWAKPVVIGRSSGQSVTDPISKNPLATTLVLPSQTVAPDGEVYVSWLQRGASNASSRIAVARSSDGGRRWIRRSFRVSGQAAMPSIAVSGDGTIGVLYYQIAASSHGGYWPARVALATSVHRARHWSQARVGGPFNLLKADGVHYRGCCFVGDYIGLTRMPHGFAAAFSMAKPIARHPIDEYFTRIATSPSGR